MPPTEPDDSGAEAAALAAFRDKRRPATLVAGALATVDIEVTQDLTAESVGSGDLPVLASPAIVRLVEQAAVAMLRGRLPGSLTTVGSSFALQHVAPTPLGASVRMTVRLDAGEDRTLTFGFTVGDDAGEVARGSHERVIVDRERFMANAVARRGPSSAGP